MRRLTRNGERGASAVLVAGVLIVLMGFGALAVDAGALWSDRKQLQNGADAGALAIAQACATDLSHPDCRFDSPAAGDFAERNKLDGEVEGIVEELVTTGPDRHVTVVTRSTRSFWFGQALPLGDPVAVETSATASWSGTPKSMTTIPLAVSHCQFFWQNGFYSGMPTPGTPVRIELKSKPKDFPGDPGTFPCMAGGAHNEVGGGFAWLTTTGDCETATTAGNWVSNDPGNSMPGTCSAAEIQAILGTSPGKIVKLPLFEATNGRNGSNAKYQITGYAALEIAGYCFQPSPRMAPGTPCNGDNQHIRATFVGSPSLDDAAEGGVDYGVVTVKLTD